MLEVCRDCERPIDARASVCPHCGIDDPLGENESFGSEDNGGFSNDFSHEYEAGSVESDAPWKSHFQAGIEAIADEDYDDALTSLSQALINAPDDELFQCYSMRGYVYLCLEEFDRAIDDCTAAIDCDASDGETFTWRASAYAGLGQWRQAIEDYTKAIQVSPKNAKQYRQVAASHTDQAIQAFQEKIDAGDRSAQLFIDRGVIYLFRGDVDKAIGEFSHAIELDTEEPSTYLHRARCYATCGKPSEVIKDCTRAEELGHNVSEVYLLRGASLRELGKHDEALSDLTRVVDNDKQNADAFFRRAEIYNSRGSYAEAIDDFTTAIDIDDQNTGVFVARGTAYAALGDYANAIEDYTKSLDVIAADAATLVCRGEAYLKSKDGERAIADFDEAISVNAIFAPAYRGRGNAFALAGANEDAMTEFNKAVRLDSRYAAAYASRGKTQFALKQNEEALADYEKALDLGLDDSDAAEVHYHRAIVHAESREHEKAVASYNESIRLRGDRPGVYLWRGVALGSLGRVRQALDDFCHAIDLNPANANQYQKVGQPLAKKAITSLSKVIESMPGKVDAYLSRGVAYQFLNDGDNAISDFDKVLKTNPNELTAIKGRAAVLSAREDYETAVAEFDRAMEVDGDNASLLYQRGLCYLRSGRSEQARDDLSNAIQLDGKNADYFAARGQAHAALRDLKSAEADFDRAIRGGSNASVLIGRAQVRKLLGKTDDAIRDFSAALDSDNKNAAVLFQRGVAYEQAQRLDEAVNDFASVISLQPGLVEAQCRRALLLVKQGQYEKAIIEITKAIGQVNGKSSLARVLECRAKIYYSISRMQRAIEDYSFAIQLKPAGYNLANAYYGRGLAYLQSGENKEALRNIAKALRLDSEMSSAETALAWLRESDGDQPTGLKRPTKKVAPTRPPIVREEVTVGNASGEWETDPIHDQWIVTVGDEPDEKEYGPVKKERLDSWCQEGRIDELTLVLRIDWEAPRWATDVYPELAEEINPTNSSVVPKPTNGDLPQNTPPSPFDDLDDVFAPPRNGEPPASDG